MTLFIEQTLLANLRWVVFAPNDEPLWTAIKTSIEGFMLSLSRQGALVCARGRPTCQFCGNPLDPEGHVCPAMNGHGRLGQA